MAYIVKWSYTCVPNSSGLTGGYKSNTPYHAGPFTMYDTAERFILELAKVGYLADAIIEWSDFTKGKKSK